MAQYDPDHLVYVWCITLTLHFHILYQTPQHSGWKSWAEESQKPLLSRDFKRFSLLCLTLLDSKLFVSQILCTAPGALESAFSHSFNTIKLANEIKFYMKLNIPVCMTCSNQPKPEFILCQWISFLGWWQGLICFLKRRLMEFNK